ncbi:MAG: hypothetical protein IJE70_01405 [Oscillospiraceae bacterium]|nr:hypothetical protein [Oscillospiraceae bacterium]
MSFIRDWVGSIAAATMLLSVISALVPKTSAKRAVMLCGSIIMTAVLISPINSFDSGAVLGYGEKYGKTVEEMAETLRRENEKLSSSIIEKNLGAYILQRADSMGVECMVDVKCTGTTPQGVTVKVESVRDGIALSDMIKEEFGIKEVKIEVKDGTE